MITPPLLQKCMASRLAFCFCWHRCRVRHPMIGRQLTCSSSPIDYFNFSIRYINTNLSSLFPRFQLRGTFLKADGQKLGSAVKEFFDGYLEPPNKALLIGASYSPQAAILADAARYYYLPQIGYCSTWPDLSDKSAYPYFIRMPITNSLFVQPTVELIKRYGWKKFGLITTDFEVLYPVTLKLEEALIKNNLTSYQKMIYHGDVTDALANMLKNDIRIFVIVRSGSHEDFGKRFDCVLKKLGAFGPKYFWIQLGFPYVIGSFPGSCPDSERATALEGSVEFDSAVLDPNLVETRVGVAGKSLTELFSSLLAEYPARRADAVAKTVFGLHLRFDSVMSAALAINRTIGEFDYTEALQLGNSSFKAALFRNLMNLDFLGLSGRVAFDENGDRTSVAMLYQIRNLTRDLVAVFDPMTNRMTWQKDLWFAGGSPPVEAPELVTQHLKLSRAGTIGIVSAASAGIALSLAAVAVNSRFRELRLIKMSSPLVNNVIGLGCLMCYSSCIVTAANSYLGSVSAAMCWAQTALLTVGYSAAFGAMLAKTWRVHRIFTNVSLRRLAIKDWHLYGVILAVLSADLLLLTLWALIDPIKVGTAVLTSAAETLVGTQTKTIVDECQCRNMQMWIGIELGIKGILLLFAIFFAWETRNVRVEALNDSKQIGICVYNATVMGIIGTVLLFALPAWSLELRVILITGCIILCATTTLVLVFGSKLPAIWALLNSNRVNSTAVGPSNNEAA